MPSIVVSEEECLHAALPICHPVIVIHLHWSLHGGELASTFVAPKAKQLLGQKQKTIKNNVAPEPSEPLGHHPVAKWLVTWSPAFDKIACIQHPAVRLSLMV